MTDSFELRRRTPARQLRYLADKLNEVRGEDVTAQTILVACRHLLVELAADLETADEQAETDSYAAMVNAPLRPETIAAIAKRIKAGDYPVRKVKPRKAP